jgi:SAM-dependent methyltransferase
MDAIWTLDGDETSWPSWAENYAAAAATPFMLDLIEAYQAARPGWALDIGCGTGRSFQPLEEAGYQVIGIDPVLQSVRICRQRVSQSGIRAYPLLASAAQIPLPNRSIAFAFAVSSLFHLSEPELGAALREIHRLLHPGGRAVLHFLDLEDWRRTLAQEIPPGQAPVPGYRAVVTCFCSQETLRAWIERAGLHLDRLELRTSSRDRGEQRNWLAHCTHPKKL